MYLSFEMAFSCVGTCMNYDSSLAVCPADQGFTLYQNAVSLYVFQTRIAAVDKKNHSPCSPMQSWLTYHDSNEHCTVVSSTHHASAKAKVFAKLIMKHSDDGWQRQNSSVAINPPNLATV